MRQPQTPPPVEISSSTLKELDGLIRNHGNDPMVRGKYRHWDKLRHLKPPEGLSHKQWWTAIKLARSVGRIHLDLLDTHGRTFTFIVPDAAQQMLHELSMGVGGKLLVPERVVNSQTRDQYYVSSLIEESITSSQLEGAATTRRDAENMLRAGRKPKDKSERMILNNYLAMRHIRKIADKPLTPARVFELHRLVTTDTLERPDQAGRLRHADESINVVDTVTGEVLHAPPHADELPQRLEAMCDFANGKTPDKWIHPLVRPILLHFWLAYDHPFVDGNGRTARALFYLSAMQQGFWLAEFLSVSSVILKGPAKYSRAFLYTETDDNDLTYFLMYHLEVLRQAVQNLHDFVERKAGEIRDLEDRLRGTAELNPRQRALVSHALRHPRHEYTMQSHRESHGIVYDTARRDLMDLAERGLLLKRKRGKAFVYTPAPDITERLSE
jgi:Fic family protein